MGNITFQTFEQFVVSKADQWEVFRQPLYDRLTYAALGQTQLKFFAVPSGSGGKTDEDTNMEVPGALSEGINFLVQGIEVYFFPSTPTVAADLPAAFGAQAAAQIVNDAYIFRRAGNLKFRVLAKDFLNVSPLQTFPSTRQFHIEAALADASTAGANFQSRIAFADAVGRPFAIDPHITLESNTNFNVTANWLNGLQALPSTNDAVMQVNLEGVQARRVQ